MSVPSRPSWNLRLPRFSLRTGLVVFLLFGTGLGMSARWIQAVRERGDAQNWLISYSKATRPNAGTPLTVNYAPEQDEPRFTSLVRAWVHPEYRRKIYSLNIDGAQLSHEAAQNIQRVYAVENIVAYSRLSQSSLSRLVSAPGLKRIHLYGAIGPGTDSLELNAFPQATSLEWLELQADQLLTAPVAKALVAPPNLKTIWLHRIHPSNLPEFATPPMLTELSVIFHQTSHETPHRAPNNAEWDASVAKMFDELAKREQLRRLRIFSAELSDPNGLTRFCESSKLRYLHLEGCFVTPECLREVAKLRKIETLHLHWSPMTSEHLEILATMKTLRGIHALRCDSSDVTKAAVAKLEAALPKCKITRYLR